MFISHDVFPEIQTFEVVDHTFRFPLRTLYDACIKDDCELPFDVLLESSMAIEVEKVKMTKWSGNPFLPKADWINRELSMTASLKQGSFKWNTRVSKMYKFRAVNAKHYSLYARTHTPDLPWSSSFTLHEQWMLYDVSDNRGSSMRLVLTGGVEIHGNWFKDVIRRNGEFVLREVLTDFVVQMLTKLRPLKEKLRRMQLEQAEQQIKQLDDNVNMLSENVISGKRLPTVSASHNRKPASPFSAFTRQHNIVSIDSFDEPHIKSGKLHFLMSDDLPPGPTTFERAASSSVNLNDYIVTEPTVSSNGRESTPKLRPLTKKGELPSLDITLSDYKPPSVIKVSDLKKNATKRNSSFSIERPREDAFSCLSRRLQKLHESLRDFKVKGDQLQSEISDFMSDIWRRKPLKKRTSCEMREEDELDRMISLKKRKITLALNAIEQKSRDLAEAGVRDRIIDVAIQSVKYQLNTVDPPSKDNFSLFMTHEAGATSPPPFLCTEDTVPKDRPCVIS